MVDDEEREEEGEYGVFDDFEPCTSDGEEIDVVEEHDTFGIDDELRADNGS